MPVLDQLEPAKSSRGSLVGNTESLLPKAGASMESLHSHSGGERSLDVSQWFYQAAKRAIDVVVSGVLLLLLSPLFLIVGLIIRLSDGGPAIFSQERVGEDGRRFVFYKFRSMVLNAEQLKAGLKRENRHGERSITFKIVGDPRITPFGHIIRRASIDELPQLWNVFTGDMSLVGPRPAVPSEVEQYTAAQRRRLAVKPGLTCLWQVSGRSNLGFDDQVKMDVEYIQNRSLWIDFMLLVLTVPAVLSGRGAC